MKKGKNLLIVLISIICFAVSMNIVSAATELTVSDDLLTLKSDGTVFYTDTGENHTGFPRIANKNLNSSAAFCLSGFQVHAGGSCSLDNSILSLTDKQKLAMGYILNKIYVGQGKDNKAYYFAEMAELYYLYKEGKINSDSISHGTGVAASDNYFDNLFISSYTFYGNTFDSLRTEANDYASDFLKDVPSAAPTAITLSSTTLSFSQSGDNYVATFSVTNSSKFDSISYSKEGANTGKYNVTQNGNSFTVTVPKSNLTSGTFSVNIKIKGSYSINGYTLNTYSCAESGEDYQDIATLTTTSKTGNLEKNITGSIIRGGLTIVKQDGKGNNVEGAKIKIEGPNGYVNVITTTTTPTTLNNLDLGTYTVYENEVLSGYLKLVDQEIVELTTSVPTNSATLINTETTAKISKKDATGTKLLEGATLQLQDSDGNVVKYCTSETDNKCEWVSTDKEYTITKIPAGKYYLVEISSPDGYAINEEKVELVITDTCSATNNSGTNADNKSCVCTGDTCYFKAVMKDKPTELKITKISSETGNALEGAKLQLQDSDGNVVEYCPLEEGNKCEWTTTKDSYSIFGLKKGKYYLVEVSAPEGYEKFEDKIEIEITEGTELIEVEMENTPDFPVPDTLGGKSAMLITIAMFNIALGIGIITYVRKKKISE